ncbi:hypothetical protein HHX48_16505 [Salinimonas sp. HHU 13199]|uniref:Uncharacterized protein n=1 Tax=Salinimonas profundi TaxID=2729140 RepID=A0ABR8LMB5_9ALTE|nr:hypothetical protein [Salinimonas profundi]MBD3587339.1 hypothetical protein [Salinimonas profundi]
MAGILLTNIATICLYRGWLAEGANKSKASQGFTFAGWLLIPVSIYVSGLESGIRFAVAFAIITVCFSAWLLIVRARTQRHTGRERAKHRKALNWRAAAQGLIPQLLTAIALIPVCGTLAAFVTVGITHLLPFERVNNLALGIFTMPLIWAGLALWYMAETNRMRLYLCGSLLAACSAFSVYA